ncbi:MAG: hypothetical protein JXR91_13655 [Deltaproteobacteria bacterium]|nr:hypothetical protein [Deltaproteobacteria bacterium]
MGKVLQTFFDQAQQEGGIVWRMKLAMLTKMGPTIVKDAPDTPENIKLFKDSLQKIRDSNRPLPG